MPTTLNSGLQLPDKGSVDWYSSMQTNYGLLDNHLENTDVHVTAEDKANWDSKQGSLSQDQLDAIAQVATNTNDIATLQSDKANASHTHSSSDITDIDDYATKQYVDNSISGLVDNAPDALNTLNELSAALNDDSNFASTVTTALAAKADSADLATVATSGSYTDLTDKPTINDSTITIQKNGSTVDTFTTNGSDKTIDIPVPTKTSDLTNDSDFVVSSSLATVATSGFYNDLDNKPTIPSKISDLIDDSNFVDMFNPAVSSGITSSKVTSYDSHIVDTDIHVTTADKTSWNTVTSKANDSDVVHKSGNETKSGELTLSDTLNSSDIVPIANNSYSSGSSNNQWNNIYSKNYYYNGVAWGLDKANVWSDKNTFTGNVTIDKNSNYPTTASDTALAFTGGSSYVFFRTKGSSNYKSYNSWLWGGYQGSGYAGEERMGHLKIYRANAVYGETGEETPDTSFSFIDVALHYKKVNITDNVSFKNDGTTNACYPTSNNATDLGTSTSKWKSINGLNPSSLGMPDLSNGIDISSYITDLKAANNEYTPSVNGWISIRSVNATKISIRDKVTSVGNTSISNTANYLTVTTPVVANRPVYITVMCTSLSHAYFIPCLGNV